ncbi:hypothetical protein A6A19_08285 [Actinobacillus delphinicola]|uniref:hypothetical protein n=1 Tax=Actinobacillus delphinicola TaxID=51161 RepID=UPI0024430ADA|nr:hypothetical protein [Actinobacillus delphinicola]MDG6897971.1 hypothetical protein [Actinobacillus delphinicola]
MESQKGKCTHHSDCEFEIHKDDLCILHCEKTGEETEEEISLFNARLADYAAIYLEEKSGGAISKEVTKSFLTKHVHNKIFEEYSLEIKDINFPSIDMAKLSIKNMHNKKYIQCDFNFGLFLNENSFNYYLFSEYYIDCEISSLIITDIDFQKLYNNRKVIVEKTFYNKKKDDGF